MDRPTVLLLIDDRALAESLAARLRQEAYAAVIARDENDAMRKAQEHAPASIVVGLSKSGRGEAVCRRIRSHKITHEIPVVVLTDSSGGTEYAAMERVVAIARQPLEIEEVMGEIQTLSRPQVWEPVAGDVVEHLGVRVDRIRHEAAVDDTKVGLTMTEFRLLDCFLRQPGRAFTRALLLAAAIGEDAVVLERTIDVHIKSLRRKLGPAGKLIETVRGIGYRFRETVL